VGPSPSISSPLRISPIVSARKAEFRWCSTPFPEQAEVPRAEARTVARRGSDRKLFVDVHDDLI
jgi:hypothetical protein